jgi:hypothetical protein
MLIGVDVKKEKDRLGGLFGAESLGTVRFAGRGGGLGGMGAKACGGGVWVRVWKANTHTQTHTRKLFLSLSFSLSSPPRAHTDWRWGL